MQLSEDVIVSFGFQNREPIRLKKRPASASLTGAKRYRPERSVCLVIKIPELVLREGGLVLMLLNIIIFVGQLIEQVAAKGGW